MSIFPSIQSGSLGGVAALCLCAAVLCSCARPESATENPESVERKESKAGSVNADTDQTLARAASEALGDREGAVIVMDPQTGRVRAVVNPRLAFEQAFPPGSSIKPFAALAAMRAGLVDRESRTLCRGRYRRGDFQVYCSHPKSETPFDLIQALGYSCNYYFAGLAERLSASSFRSMLASFGLGARTGVNYGAESEGTLSAGEWRIEDGLGGGDHLLVTPIQLLAAYSALMNGGHLYRPQIAAPDNFTADERARLQIDPSHRAALIEGCRAAVEYGTASHSDFASQRLFIFGKTGTSTSSNGFRTQGWFVAFAADATARRDPPPESLRLEVMVFLKRAHGADGVEVARSIFEAYVKNCGLQIADFGLGRPDSNPHSAIPNPPSANPQSAIRNPRLIKVLLVRENRTETVPLEDYLVGVLAVEAAAESEIEALKAQAVVSRTFTLKNLGRHASEGFDLCSSTHCQQYTRTDVAAGGARVDAYRRAVGETSGQVLLDESGDPADAYFSAACGGVTANIESLWGEPAPGYLRGIRDDYCATGEHRSWTDEIPRAQLLRALRSDPRSDVGSRLDDVVVTKRDATGRAELISIEGQRRRQLRGWEFKVIVGRALGWMVLKSTRFEVSRRGASFVFRGSGFGHGLGMCQEGAHVMARRGIAYRQILSHYFPGARVSTGVNAKTQGSKYAKQDLADPETSSTPDTSDTGTSEPGRFPAYHASVFLSPISFAPWRPRALALPSERYLSSEHFRVSYRGNEERSEVEAVLATLEVACTDLGGRLRAASLAVPDSPVDVVIHQTTEGFVAATGQPWWVAGATHGGRMQLQPLRLLRRRRVLRSTLRHEFAHSAIERIGAGRTARWLAEGLAAHFAGEGAFLKRFNPKSRLPLDEIERRLEHPASAGEMRSLYAAAYREVRSLIQKEGEASVWRRVTR